MIFISFRYNGKTITRERLRKTVLSQLGLPISPYPLFVIQQNHIQTFCVNDSSFLVNYIHEVQTLSIFIHSLIDKWNKPILILSSRLFKTTF